MTARAYKFFFLAIMIGIALFFNRAPNAQQFTPDPGDLLRADVALSPDNVFVSSTVYNLKKPVSPDLISSSSPQESPYAAASKIEVPGIESGKALVADLVSGEHYFLKNESANWPIASLSKLITAAVAHDLLDPDREMTFTAADFSASDDTKLRYFKIGSTYKVRDILRGMLVVSSNEAAEALANFYGRPTFMRAMNEKARSWNLNSTFFEDPSGLSPQNQSNLLDLEKISFQIYANYRFLFDVTRTPEISITEAKTRRTTLLDNINSFAGQVGFTGGKTGYTDEAGGNLLSVFSVNGNPILIIVLESKNRFGDTQKLLDWLIEARFKSKNLPADRRADIYK